MMADWRTLLLHGWADARQFIEPLIPAALGAAVAQAWEPGLSLRQRLIQWCVGVSCAAFLVPAVGHVFHWGDPLERGVGFVVATLAFKAVPPLHDALIDGATGSLRSLPDVFRSWTRKPGADPDKPEGDGT